ncbi:MAG: carboxypeptidase regulatory-like domain-containing protein [Hyphomonas sp.]|nr:carboxypeptidase regulatory-like domain-containing protein [Hyphomonas sp.]
MKNWTTFGRGAAVSAIALSIAGVAMAQVTTSAIRGAVTDEDGAAVAGATVTILHEPSGTVSMVTTNAAGQFAAQNLRVGGPYSLTISGEGFIPARAEDVFANLGSDTDLDLVITRDDDAARMETVVITGSAMQVAQVSTGPSSVYNLATLENAPAMNRDIKDIVRLDPRVYVDEAFNDSINCAGANPRYNSLTVDGARLSDNFGLNSNGYPTERIPFSFDSIEQVSVELAPFDVEYGQFTACNINAVTKSGGNEIHGGVFFDYTSDSLTGDETDGVKQDLGDFDEKRYGFNVGVPLIKDKLFLFGSYEKFEGANIFGFTPESAGITQADYDQIISIAEGYGYVSGGLPTSLSVEDEKIFVKLDWNINNDHRAAFTYNYNDGFNYSPSDSGSTRLADGNHYYERGAKLQNYSGALYSDWSDTFSTEFRVTYVDLDNRQIPVAGLDNFGEVQVDVGGSTVYLGADDSRHANVLNYTTLNYKGKADWTLGDHVVTFGAEREEFEVFNLFIQEVQGEWVFDSIADFAAGDFSDFRYENAAGTNNQDDGAADFGYEINTIYVQDDWQISDKLNLVMGLRYDFYTSDDAPMYNPDFEANYGFGNNETMDGRDLLQPRLGFTYEVNDDISLHGGIGLYSGGNPNVWISNNYSNNGVTLFEDRIRGGNINDYTYAGGTGSPFIDVPDESIAAVAAGVGSGPVNAIDPDFELPSEWKYALGAVMNYDSGNPMVGDNWTFMADILYSKTNEAAHWTPISWVQTGVGPDGRPIYSGNTNDFVLTNAPEKGDALVLSAGVAKEYDNGIDWSLAYAYTDADDANPMTSSVAFSNFSNYTTYDAVSPALGTSDYEVAHRINLTFNWEKEFVTDYFTRLSVFGTANQGAPYSYTFGSNTAFSPLFSNRRQLAYIPEGIADARISPLSDPTAVAQLNAFIDSNDNLNEYRGSIAPRNMAADDWWTKFDLKLTQELPGFREQDRAEAFMTIENVGNLLNSDWGVLREHGFPANAELYSIDGIDAENRYIISGFNSNPDRDSIVASPSLWQVHFGVKYKF